MTNQQSAQPVVQIDLSQVYAEVRTIHDALQRIEARLSGMSDLEPRLRDLERHRLAERLPDFEARIRSLEERRMPHSVLTILAGVAGTAALIWQAVGAK